MRFFLVSHPALQPVLERLVPQTAHQIDLCFPETSAQLPELLRQTQGYDAILLPDGASVLNEQALAATDVPLVLPRVHNCAALLLGGADAYRALFTQYNGAVCFAVAEALETLHFSPAADCNCLCYLADTALGVADGSIQARLTARVNGWDYFNREINYHLLEQLLCGNWEEEQLLVVPRGMAVSPTCSRELLALQS
ncbi:MAG: DUF1638 domain-containing protein [Anaerotruncus sp.]|nr:DUF1638 domain-containing protein [Anaerotruncus sp.]